MRVHRLSRPSRQVHDGASASPAPAAAAPSTLGLDDWEGHWPEDDSTAGASLDPQVPRMLNPSSPTLAPG